MADAEAERLSEPVNIAQFILEWDAILKAYDNRTLEKQEFFPLVASKMGIEEEMVKKLDDVCQLTSLTCEGEPAGIYPGLDPDNNWKKTPDDVTNLATLNLHREEMQTRTLKQAYRLRTLRKLRYKLMDIPWVHEIKNRLHRDKQLPVPNDVVLSVQIFMPYFPGRNRPLQVSQEIHVLGQQHLTVLRDKIECAHDKRILGEYSDQPDFPRDNYAKDVFPSGFFFIENTFYNDFRSAYSRDISSTIIQWSKSDPRREGSYETVPMETVTFDQLTVRFGQPYVYMHQGNCEHIIMFSDMRAVHPEDCLNTEEYPLVISKYKPAAQRCKVCLQNIAAWMTKNSPLAPEDPCFFCDTCFRMMHYNEDGQKIGDFKAYPCPILK